MKMIKKTSPIWTVLSILLLMFLVSQIMYVDHGYSNSKELGVPENKSIFFTVKEHQFSVHKRGFDTLVESLKLWEYDKKEDVVYLREEALKPNEYTPLLVIYDNGADTFQKQENIVPISSFPFSLKDAGSSLQLNQINEDGKVYFQYRDKELSLEPGETYRLPYFDGLKLKMVTIENHGLFDKKQFKIMDTKEKAEE